MKRLLLFLLPLLLAAAPGHAEIVGRTQEDYIHRYVAENGQPLYFLSPESEPVVLSEDVNFDGINDIVVLTVYGASNSYYEFFVWDGGQYVLADHPSTAESGLANYQLYPEKGLVSVRASNGYAGLMHDQILLRWEGTEMVEVRRAVSSHTVTLVDDGDIHVRMEDYGRVTLRVTQPAYDAEGYRDSDIVLWEYEASLDEIYGAEQEVLVMEEAALWEGL